MIAASDTILGEFLDDMHRVERLLDLVGSFRTFGGSKPSTSVEPVWGEANQLYAAANQVRTDLPLISGSMLLYIAGRFEFFIRSIVENAAAEWSNKASSFEDLPKALKDNLKIGTLEICRSPNRYGYTELEAFALFFDLADGMRSTVKAPTIAVNVISMTDSNMRPKILADLLKRVEVLNFWRDVGKQSAIKLHLNTIDDTQCADLVQAELNAIMEARNQIAHPTSSTTFLDYEIVRGHVQLLKKLAQVTKEIVDVRLLDAPGT